MNSTDILNRLNASAEVIRALLSHIPIAQIHWKPSPDKWSILEVAAHLLDEEREDFRIRLDILLHHCDAPFPPIDPESWVTEREYAKRDLAATKQAFIEERQRSINWLRELENTAWEHARNKPGGGKLAAGDILVSWEAHDLLHIHQLTRLHWQYVCDTAKPYSGEYAGDW